MQTVGEEEGARAHVGPRQDPLHRLREDGDGHGEAAGLHRRSVALNT